MGKHKRKPTLGEHAVIGDRMRRITHLLRGLNGMLWENFPFSNPACVSVEKAIKAVEKARNVLDDEWARIAAPADKSPYYAQAPSPE